MPAVRRGRCAEKRWPAVDVGDRRWRPVVVRWTPVSHGGSVVAPVARKGGRRTSLGDVVVEPDREIETYKAAFDQLEAEIERRMA